MHGRVWGLCHVVDPLASQFPQVAEERLKQQKQDYDATLDRNLKLVDRLLADKAELTRKSPAREAVAQRRIS